LRLIVTGGGTGGHIYPAIEVARQMKEMLPSSSVLYVGTKAGMESRIVPREGLEFATVRSSGVMGKSPAVAAKGLVSASMGIKDAAGILRSFRPDVVLGTGGYASGPVVLSAYLLGIPEAIQEQNAVPGKTNQILSRVSGRTFAAWEYSRRFFSGGDRVMVTGNPVRKVLLNATREEGRRYYGIPGDARVVLLLGGSRGAKALDEAGIEMARGGLGDAWMVFITGTEYYGKVVSRLEARPENGIDCARTGDIIVRPYEHNMAMAYRAADLVVGRAGGMTLSEVTALGLPSVLVPSPNVAGNHQEHNARALEEAGAALVVREDADVQARVRDAALSLLGDAARLSEMGKASLTLGRPDAARTICRELVELARKGS
jgi:UDP-N-acetylglucosamine--N-acetylmuramyl-(pentapeptide) pyrophosphoryl-undecaprenol N-acetylglucosamine transferase